MLTACGHNCGGNALSRQWAQCADRAAYQTTDHRYDLLTGRKPNVRFRRYLVVLVVQMANVGSPAKADRRRADLRSLAREELGQNPCADRPPWVA
jgi:hypothetical protein